MSTDLETDLRREFDAAGAPSDLTFNPQSVLRQGNRTIRRHRMMTVGSAAMAVALVAVGATALTRPDSSEVPQPAAPTATDGIVWAQAGFSWGSSEVQFNRDASVESNVRYFVMAKDGQRRELGRSSIGKPGQKPDAAWKSGIVDGHPVTIGLFPASTLDLPTVTFADGGSYGVGSEELKGTGYRMFYVQYSDDATRKEPAGPVDIASIRWSAPNGIVDGIEGDHRLTGRVLDLGRGVSLEVVLRPGIGGPTTVFGQSRTQTSRNASSTVLTAATTDPSGAAVVTGDQGLFRKAKDGTEFIDGPPVAAGILPSGSSGIGWVLSAGSGASPVVVSEPMPDGRVIFAIKVQSAQESSLVQATVKTVTWTNADGTMGRKDVAQKLG